MHHPKLSSGNNFFNGSKKALTASLIVLSLLGACNTDISKEKQAKIKNLNHLVMDHKKLRDTLKTVGFNEVGELISLTPDTALNATVMEQALQVFGKDSVGRWPQNARIRLFRAGFLTMQEAAIQAQDLPRNTIEEKAIYHNEGVAKKIEFHEIPTLYKNMVIIFGTDYEKKQFLESLGSHGKDIKRVATENSVTIYKYKNTTLYALEGQAGITAFNEKHASMKPGLIVLKGHYGMLPEITAFKDHIVNKSTIIFAGGCGSFYNTSDYLKFGGVPITNSQTGQGAINDPLTFSLVKGLADSGFNKTTKDYRADHPKNDEKLVFPDEELAQKVNGSL